MGLFERTIRICGGDMEVLLGPNPPEDLLKRLILELDAYRRDLVQSIATHSKEAEWLEAHIAERSAALALWRARLQLARQNGRDNLARAAEERGAEELAARDEFEKRQGTLRATIANLQVNLDKVERFLKHMREKKRSSASGAVRLSAEEQRQLAANGFGGPIQAGGTFAPPDPVEEEFRRLEQEEVAQHLVHLRKVTPSGNGREKTQKILIPPLTLPGGTSGSGRFAIATPPSLSSASSASLSSFHPSDPASAPTKPGAAGAGGPPPQNGHPPGKGGGLGPGGGLGGGAPGTGVGG